jgi:hypothetical protein
LHGERLLDKWYPHQHDLPSLIEEFMFKKGMCPILLCLALASCGVIGLSTRDGVVTVVAAGENGTLRTTEDGLAWSLADTDFSADLKSVAAVRKSTAEGGSLVLVATTVFDGINPSEIYTSTDGGGEWSKTYTVSPANSPINRMSYIDGVYIVLCGIDAGMILSSTDGANWDAQISGGLGFYSLATGGGRLIAAGQGDRIAVSSDGGMSWMKASGGDGTLRRFYGMAYGNGIFVGVGVGTNGCYARWATSLDGTAWENDTVDPNRILLADIAFGKGVFVAVGYKIVMSSTDGIDWENRLTSDVHFSSITYVEGKFITCGVFTQTGDSVLEVITVDDPEDCIQDVEAVQGI